jgi:hypothetical protein
MARVPHADAGLASGIINVSQQIGGALGLALLGTIATNHTKDAEHSGLSPLHAVVSGDHVAYLWGIGAVVLGLIIAWSVLRRHGIQSSAPVEAVQEAAEIGSELPGGVGEAVEVTV